MAEYFHKGYLNDQAFKESARYAVRGIYKGEDNNSLPSPALDVSISIRLPTSPGYTTYTQYTDHRRRDLQYVSAMFYYTCTC